MPYRLDDRRPLADELERLAREQLDRALAALAAPEADVQARVHAARKRCKKVRALLRLVRPHLRGRDWRALNVGLRDAARRVSEGRDAAVFPATYDRVRDRFGADFDRRGSAPIRAALTRRAKARTAELHGEAALERLAGDLEAVHERLGEVRLRKTAAKAGAFDAVRPGLAATHDRARAALDALGETPGPEAFHEWRKHVKYHRLQLGLLVSAWPAVVTARHDEARRLGDLLGGAQDLAMLEAHLVAVPGGLGDPARVDVFLGLARRLRAELEAEALPLGRRLFAERGARVAKRLARWRAAG